MTNVWLIFNTIKHFLLLFFLICIKSVRCFFDCASSATLTSEHAEIKGKNKCILTFLLIMFIMFFSYLPIREEGHFPWGRSYLSRAFLHLKLDCGSGCFGRIRFLKWGRIVFSKFGRIRIRIWSEDQSLKLNWTFLAVFIYQGDISLKNLHAE